MNRRIHAANYLKQKKFLFSFLLFYFSIFENINCMMFFQIYNYLTDKKFIKYFFLFKSHNHYDHSSKKKFFFFVTFLCLYVVIDKKMILISSIFWLMFHPNRNLYLILPKLIQALFLLFHINLIKFICCWLVVLIML